MSKNSLQKNSDWLQQASAELRAKGIGTAQLDALVLLEDCLGKDRAYLLAHPELTISPDQLLILKRQLTRRSEHTPLAYIRQKTEFYGRDFYIDERVLEPRPETETMIEMLAKCDLSQTTRLADVGTGSGCIGVTVALEFPQLTVDMYDIDKAALVVAKKNAKHFGVKLSYYSSDLLEPTIHNYDIIMANLPYVPDHFQLNSAAEAEPRIAIFGGSDGLDLYRRLFKQLKAFPWKPRLVMTESLPPQHEHLASIAANANFQLTTTDDFIQCFTFNSPANS